MWWFGFRYSRSDEEYLGEIWRFGCKYVRSDEGYIGLVVSLVVGLVDLMKGPWGDVMVWFYV